MQRLVRLLLVVAICLLGTAGCQKLDYEKTVNLGAGEVQAISIGPPTREQKITVVASSTGSTLNVCLVLEKDVEAAKQAMLDGKAPKEPLASKEKAQEATLEATVPAKTGYAIVLGGASKSCEVKVKVTGR
jgi:hypothetical protein